MPRPLDDYHAHEALDRANMLMEMVETHLQQHPYVTADKRLRKLADRAATALAEMYQYIGEKHL